MERNELNRELERNGGMLVEEHCQERHGHFDDCDYVVTCFTPHMVFDARDVAERLSVCDTVEVERDGLVMFFCCHA